jgi:hypothetical protein
MAKKRTSTAITTVRATPVRTQTPIIRIATPRPVQASKPKRAKSHRRSKGGGGMGYDEKALLMVGAGGAALGFIESTSIAEMLPDIPIVGKKGAITIAAYFLGRQGIGGDIVKKVAFAGAAICGYQLGKEGEVTG